MKTWSFVEKIEFKGPFTAKQHGFGDIGSVSGHLQLIAEHPYESFFPTHQNLYKTFLERGKAFSSG